MSHEWLNLPGAELLPAPPDDPLLGWLFESDLPPGEPTSADDPPLESDPTPPTFHPAGPYAAGPTCPEIRIYRSHPPECGGLRSDVAERARAYQLATLRDPYEDWENAAGQDSVRAMRRPSAMTVFRLIAHFAHPEESRDEGHDRVGLLHRVLNSDDGIPRSSMQQWKETSDFMANGLIRLLGLFAHESWAPDANDPNTTELVIPCELQWQIVRQLLGWKYWGDEPARHPEAPAHDEVYWSENHQILFATAEYLAGQFLPTHTFLPIVHYQAGGSWQTQTDGAWRMSADDRMAHAYPRLVRWLDHRLMFGFSEWTSPVYAEYDLAALANLVDFCDAPEIVTKASMVLDILLLELSRFAGHGRGVGTAGRAYSVHKWTGWDNSVCDTLQILYGRWPVEPRQEQVLEEWRLQNAVAIKAEDRAGAEETYRKEADDQELDDQAAAAYVGQKLGQWDLDNPGPFRRVPPFGTDWNAADSPGAHSLASLRQYCIPEVVMWFSDNQQPPRFERSRVSIDFGEGERNYGIGFQQPMDLIDWWSRGGFATPETIVGSRDLADTWDVEDATPFGDIPGMTVKVPAVGTWLMPDAVAVTAADKLSVESYGSCLTTANLALWREGDVSLSSAQKFRVNQLGRQAHIWQASLGPYITIWSTYPAAESAERGTDGPTWWSGNAGQPRVVQRDDALICVHDSKPVLLHAPRLRHPQPRLVPRADVRRGARGAPTRRGRRRQRAHHRPALRRHPPGAVWSQRQPRRHMVVWPLEGCLRRPVQRQGLH